MGSSELLMLPLYSDTPIRKYEQFRVSCPHRKRSGANEFRSSRFCCPSIVLLGRGAFKPGPYWVEIMDTVIGDNADSGRSRVETGEGLKRVENSTKGYLCIIFPKMFSDRVVRMLAALRAKSCLLGEQAFRVRGRDISFLQVGE